MKVPSAIIWLRKMQWKKTRVCFNGILFYFFVFFFFGCSYGFLSFDSLSKICRLLARCSGSEFSQVRSSWNNRDPGISQEFVIVSNHPQKVEKFPGKRHPPEMHSHPEDSRFFTGFLTDSPWSSTLKRSRVFCHLFQFFFYIFYMLFSPPFSNFIWGSPGSVTLGHKWF